MNLLMFIKRGIECCMCPLLAKMETLWMLVMRTLRESIGKKLNDSFEKLFQSNKD